MGREHNTEGQELCIEAVKTSMIQRGMAVDLGCPIYRDEEITEHMVFGCRWNEPLWVELLWLRQNRTQPTDVTGWMDQRRRGETGATHHRMAQWDTCMLTTWFIWKARCKNEFEGVQPAPASVIVEMKRAVTE